MRFEVKLALKYLRARKKSLARFTSVVAVTGIAAGVAALIVAQSLARGFQEEMRDKILANTAHVSVFRTDDVEISDWETLKPEIEKIENVRKITPTSFENAAVITQNETSYAILKVVSQKTNAANRKDVAIGVRLAEKLNLKIGDLTEIATLERNEPERARVAEIFETGLYEYDAAWIIISPEFFAYLDGQKIYQPKSLQISVADIYRTKETAEKLRAALGENYKIVDWQEANRPLFAALSLEKKASVAVLSLIIFIAALNITTTLALLVGERRLDIAVLRTCGAKTRSLLAIFTFEGLLLGGAGITGGVALGLLACFFANRFKVISLSEEVYSLSFVPLRPAFADVFTIAALTFFLCLLAAVYPAYRAGKIKPLENLKF